MDKGTLFIIFIFIIIGLIIFFVFLVVKGIKGRNEELPEIKVLFGKSSNGHDRPQALPPESIKNDNPLKP